MGGIGSGRWYQHKKKHTIEECWTLDIANMPLHDPLTYPLNRTLQAKRISGDRRTMRIRYTLAQEDSPVLDLTYTSDQGLLETEVDERVELLTTSPNFGGVRLWFACPFSVNGERCGSRVAKL